VSGVSVEIVFTGERLPMGQLLDLAESAEAAGFGGIWMAEAYRSCTVPLATIAQRTTRARLGSNVAQWTRSLPLLDLEAGDLAEVSEGRFRLGLGTSTKDWNEKWHGIAYERPLRRMREYVEALRLLWTAGPESPVSYGGEFFRVENYLRFNGPLAVPVPIHLAVTRTGMATLAGELADGVNFNSMVTTTYIAEVLLPAVARGAARTGRGLADLDLGDSVITAVSDDAAEALDWNRRQVAFYCVFTTYFEEVMRLHGFEDDYVAVRALFESGDLEAAIARVPDEMVDTFTLAGTPEQVRAKVRERYDGLVDFVMLSPPSFTLDPDVVLQNQRNMIAAFAEEGAGA
jgi:probable F420-dependent oxidoreductase